MMLRKVSVGRDQGRQDQLLRLQMLAPDILIVLPHLLKILMNYPFNETYITHSILNSIPLTMP